MSNEETTAEPQAESASETAAAPAAAAQEESEAPRRRRSSFRESSCPLCRDQKKWLDYKETDMLQTFCRSQGRMKPRRKAGTCARHQRMLKRAIKQSRYIGLLSPTDTDMRVAMREY